MSFGSPEMTRFEQVLLLPEGAIAIGSFEPGQPEIEEESSNKQQTKIPKISKKCPTEPRSGTVGTGGRRPGAIGEIRIPTRTEKSAPKKSEVTKPRVTLNSSNKFAF